MHHHGAEHWVMVRGTARVTIVAPSIASGKIGPQTGSYLGEDNIVRFEDDCHRS
jgi:Mannose-6-phosphate isomerase